MRFLKKLLVTVCLTLLCSGPAMAADFQVPSDILQPEFNSIVTEAARLTAYRSMVPAEPGGLTGFDAGIALSGVEVESALWSRFISDDEDAIAVPRLMVRKGLPLNIDVGAYYADVSDYDITMQGAEIQWALLEGTVATPALALRGSYTELDADGELEVKTAAADLVVSKGFTFLTPYAGIGTVSFDGEYTGGDPVVAAAISDFDDNETRIFAGLQIAMTLLRITAEYEQMDEPVYSLKLSLGW